MWPKSKNFRGTIFRAMRTCLNVQEKSIGYKLFNQMFYRKIWFLWLPWLWILTLIILVVFIFLWYSSFVISFPRFFKRFFRLVNILLLRHSQNNYQIWLDKSNLMCEELSYQIINTSAVNQAVFYYY